MKHKTQKFLSTEETLESFMRHVSNLNLTETQKQAMIKEILNGELKMEVQVTENIDGDN